MRYQGSEAYSMETAERRRERLEAEARPSFEVVSGGGLDARVRRGVSPRFVVAVRAVVAAFVVFVALSAVRVALTTATVSVLRDNASLKAQIEDAQVLDAELRVERSVLSGNSRITRIATQNYGMVAADERLSVALPAAEADGDAAQAAPAAGTASDVS